MEKIRRYKKTIKYIYFVVLAIAICWAEWHYSTLHGLIVNKPQQITKNDIPELHYWSNAVKLWGGVGIISIAINYLSIRKDSGEESFFINMFTRLIKLIKDILKFFLVRIRR